MFTNADNLIGELEDEAADAVAPLARAARDLTVRIRIEAMDGNDKRNAKFTLQEHSCMSGGKGAMGMNYMDGLALMQSSIDSGWK